ncbi:MAG: efflux RND transporter periplasmic adaptor subunit [Bacteroidetes bacterium]|nr:efflux RND transporter periplasmic adaptor subunit [Bacteroidota bacterium]
MRHYLFIVLLIPMLYGCKKEQEEQSHLHFNKPKVNGNLINFLDDSTAAYFTAQSIETTDLQSDFNAPARVVATVMTSSENPSLNLVLFDNAELTNDYTLLLQHLANIGQIEEVTIKQRTIELERIQDLQKHGAATGHDVLEAQTALALERTRLTNEKASLIEHESILKLAGFSTEVLRKAKPNSVWVISEIAENQIGKVVAGQKCLLTFSSIPNQDFTGVIEDVGDVVDNVTRLLKVRIAIINRDRRLKAGMFGTARFGLKEGKFLTIPLEALVIVQGKNYVFIQKSDLEFERRAVSIGQQAGSRIIIFDGLSAGDKVVTKGTMQLKGLSFGY